MIVCVGASKEAHKRISYTTVRTTALMDGIRGLSTQLMIEEFLHPVTYILLFAHTIDGKNDCRCRVLVELKIPLRWDQNQFYKCSPTSRTAYRAVPGLSSFRKRVNILWSVWDGDVVTLQVGDQTQKHHLRFLSLFS